MNVKYKLVDYEKDIILSFHKDGLDIEYRHQDNIDISSLIEKDLCYHANDGYYYFTEAGKYIHDYLLLEGKQNITGVTYDTKSNKRLGPTV